MYCFDIFKGATANNYSIYIPLLKKKGNIVIRITATTKKRNLSVIKFYLQLQKIYYLN